MMDQYATDYRNCMVELEDWNNKYDNQTELIKSISEDRDKYLSLYEISYAENQMWKNSCEEDHLMVERANDKISKYRGNTQILENNIKEIEVWETFEDFIKSYNT